ncbi:antifreeze protein [Mycena polygramma]|nr:antifreeze protein [Mycena polygramma]
MVSRTLAICFLAALSNVAALLGPPAVNLGTAGNYAILSKSGVSTVPPSVITGNVGVSPIAATGLTGFSLTVDSTNRFSTSTQVTGHLFAASYSPPTPAVLTAAIGDMETAYTDATGRVNPDFNNLANVAINSDVTLVGLPVDSELAFLIHSPYLTQCLSTQAWIFQVAGTLTVAAGKKMILVGALAQNIVWVVAVAVTLGAGAHTEGIVLGKSSITLQTGATANSRLLAQTSVALQQATVNN